MRCLRERVLHELERGLPRCESFRFREDRSVRMLTSKHNASSLRSLLRIVLLTVRHLPHLSRRSTASLERCDQVHHRDDRLVERDVCHVLGAHLLGRIDLVLRRVQPAVRDVLQAGRGRMPVVQEPERAHARRRRVRRGRFAFRRL